MRDLYDIFTDPGSPVDWFDEVVPEYDKEPEQDFPKGGPEEEPPFPDYDY